MKHPAHKPTKRLFTCFTCILFCSIFSYALTYRKAITQTIKLGRSAQLFVLGSLFSLLSFAQSTSNKKIDSLLNLLKTAKEDTNKVNALNALSEQLWYTSNYTNARKYADSALRIAEKLNFRKGIGIAFSNIGIVCQRQGNLKEALQSHEISLKIFEESGNKSKVAFAYVNMADIHDRQANYPEAWKTCLASLKISEEIRDKKEMAAAYNEMGNINLTQSNHEEALKNYFTSLEMSKELGDKRGIAIALLHIGNIYFILKNDKDALAYTRASLEIAKEIGEKHFIAVGYSNIGEYHRMKANYSEALKYLLEVLKIDQETGRIDAIASTDLLVAQLYQDLRKPPESRKYLDEAFTHAKKTGRRDIISAVYRQLIELDFIEDSLEGKHKNSFQLFKSFISLGDSIHSEKIDEQLGEIKVKYETEKKDKEITLLNNEKLIQTLALKRHKNAKNYLYAGIALLIILSFFFYRHYRTRQKLKLQTLRNKISQDLHDEVGATLTSISFLSEVVKKQTGNGQSPAHENIEKIGEFSREMIGEMNDIVWAINPANDKFEKIEDRMQNFASTLLAAKNIQFNFRTDGQIKNILLGMQQRKNLYLIFKEAVNNAAKYADCSIMTVRICKEDHHILLNIADNGKGFILADCADGNGLKNMQARAAEVNGKINIESRPGKGTSISLSIPITQNAY